MCNSLSSTSSSWCVGFISQKSHKLTALNDNETEEGDAAKPSGKTKKKKGPGKGSKRRTSTADMEDEDSAKSPRRTRPYSRNTVGSHLLLDSVDWAPFPRKQCCVR